MNWFKTATTIDPVYHGTDRDFTVFQEKDHRSEFGFWFSNSEAIARGYGATAYAKGKNPRLLKARIQLDNPILQNSRDTKITPEFIAEAKRNGHDGVIRDLKQSHIPDDSQEIEYCVFDSSQITVLHETRESYQQFRDRDQTASTTISDGGKATR